MTWVQFFGLFNDRELTIQVMYRFDNRKYHKLYLAIVKAGPRAIPVWLSFIQSIGMLTCDRRQEIERAMLALS